MASIVLTNAQVLLNAVDVSTYIRSVKINYKADTPENTRMGQATKNRLPGLLDWELDLEINQDWAAGNIDSQLFPLVGTQFAIEVRPVNGARSASNPAYTGNGILADYSPLGNKVGEVAVAPLKIMGTGTLARQIV